MAWQDPSFDASGGTDVGSSNSQDMFIGYGTEFNNSDRFILDISDVIHLLGADQTKLISWLQGTGTMPTSQTSFRHMENELFTVRDFKANLTRTADGSDYVWLLEMETPQDWQAIETSPLGDATPWIDDDQPQVFMTIDNGTRDFSVKIEKFALNGTNMRDLKAHDGGTTGAPGTKKDAIVIASGPASGATLGGSNAMVGTGQQEVSLVPAPVGYPFVGTNYTEASEPVNVNVVTPEDYLKGMPQGSGLPNETRKKSRSIENFVQIFKTPWSVSNTLKAVSMRGGDELGILRLRKTIQHKTAIEYAMMFQGGGDVGTDYGILSTNTENPLTRFKGLGVGLAKTNPLLDKPGWIYSKNADLNSDFTLSRNATSPSAIHALLEKVFDDLVDDPSETKVALCSNSWLTAIADIAANFSSGFTFGDHTVTNSLGIPGIRTLTSPVGTLRLMPFKHFRGRFEDYACVLDLKNIKYRPLRPTKMLSNVSTDEVDGQLDYMITETGMQVMHESTHAVLKLVA